MLRILHPDRAAGTLCDGIRRRDFLRNGQPQYLVEDQCRPLPELV